MIRLTIFTTHPIQYQAPWFRALAQEPGLELDVVFSYIPNAYEQGIGFCQAFEWDIPLLDGYRWRVLLTKKLPDGIPAFVRRWATDLDSTLNQIKPHLALILGWQEVSLLQASMACRQRGIPVILRGESNLLRKRSRAVSFLHRLYFARCDWFMSIGEANRALYEAAGVGADRIVSAPYFVDNKLFSSRADSIRHDRASIRLNFGLPMESVCFVFVGKFEPKKRPLDVIRGLRLALDRGADVCGLFIGTGDLMDAAKSLALELEVPVSFAGFMNQSEIERAYVAADVLVLPSDFGETWGLVVNEAMATGLPVIVSDRIGAAHDLVINGETGLIVPFGDTEAIAEAMTELTANPMLRAELAFRARERVHRDYSILGAVEAIHILIERISRCRNAQVTLPPKNVSQG